jgi:hypothetical protein
MDGVKLVPKNQTVGKKMILTKAFNVVAFALMVFLFHSSAKAGLVEFTFTGTGINGSIASGNFTVDEGSISPGYFATGGIFPSLSLNVPVGGPTSVSFDVNDIASTWFYVDTNSVAYIAPYGSHNFGPPDQNHYDLGQPSQPHLPSFVFETGLGYNGFVKDVITWSVATPANTPEPGSAALLLSSIVMGAFVLRHRSLRVAHSGTQ